MKSLHNTAIGDFTRGGQVTIHFLRMISQVIQKFGLAAIMLYSLITFGLWHTTTTEYQRYLGARYVASTAGVWLGNGRNLVPINMADGTTITVTVEQLAKSDKMRSNAWLLARLWLQSMVHSAFVAAFILLSLFVWLFNFGRSQRKETHLRGGKLVDGKELASLIRKRGEAGSLTFGGIPLVKDSETAHINITGSPGTGKTTGIYELLKQVRKRGDLVICYSPSGDFLSWFYRPKRDTILNIFDGRAPSWNLWGEFDQPYHYAMIAASMIPVPEKGDKIWAEAAQSLVAVLLRKLHQRGNATIEDLIRMVTMLPMSDIYEFLKDTEVAANLDPKNDRMGASIRSTATIALRSMTYMPKGRKLFTIKEWIENEERDRWLFLTARADQIDAARPVLSTMIEVAVSRILSLPESRTRRIWLVIDELPSLQKLPSLSLFLEQARKFGGCGFIGFQQFSQLQTVYGKELASTIVGMCSTWICYRQNDPETAKFVAEKFGKVEIEENQQGLSYGANDMRDGVSLNQQRKDRDVIMPSEVMGLPNLHGFIKLVGDLPGGRFAIKRGTIPTIAKPFEAYVHDPMEDVRTMAAADRIDLGDEEDEGQTASPPSEPLPSSAAAPQEAEDAPADGSSTEAPAKDEDAATGSDSGGAGGSPTPSDRDLFSYPR